MTVVDRWYVEATHMESIWSLCIRGGTCSEAKAAFYAQWPDAPKDSCTATNVIGQIGQYRMLLERVWREGKAYHSGGYAYDG